MRVHKEQPAIVRTFLHSIEFRYVCVCDQQSVSIAVTWLFVGCLPTPPVPENDQ